MISPYRAPQKPAFTEPKFTYVERLFLSKKLYRIAFAHFISLLKPIGIVILTLVGFTIFAFVILGIFWLASFLISAAYSFVGPLLHYDTSASSIQKVISKVVLWGGIGAFLFGILHICKIHFKENEKEVRLRIDKKIREAKEDLDVPLNDVYDKLTELEGYSPISIQDETSESNTCGDEQTLSRQYHHG